MEEMVPDDEFASWLKPEETFSHPAMLVSSSAVAYVGYNDVPAILYVYLLAELRWYEYAGVPFETYLRFMAAPSKGVFFNKEIRNNPDFPLVDRPKTPPIER